MNRIEKRVADLEAEMGNRSIAFAILPEGFTGQLPPNVIGIRTGVPRHDDDPAKFKIVGGSNEGRD